ncbi:unannotated protein [freshwater metagenome]|uniref:Unannotated protein n=1 Tax=freshwater metagenome TaxID=449393 RepID=A0A6J7ALR8_9ZZZZ
MDRRVGRVLELLRHEVLRVAGSKLGGPRNGAAHTLGAWGENQIRAVGTQQHAALLRHRLGHREHDLDASCGSGHCQRDTGVTRGRLDDDRIGADLSGCGCGVEHGHADAVLHAAGRAVELELGDHLCHRSGGDSVDAHQWRVAHECGDVVCDVGHKSAPQQVRGFADYFSRDLDASATASCSRELGRPGPALRDQAFPEADLGRSLPRNR